MRNKLQNKLQNKLIILSVLLFFLAGALPLSSGQEASPAPAAAPETPPAGLPPPDFSSMAPADQQQFLLNNPNSADFPQNAYNYLSSLGTTTFSGQDFEIAENYINQVDFFTNAQAVEIGERFFSSGAGQVRSYISRDPRQSLQAENFFRQITNTPFDLGTISGDFRYQEGEITNGGKTVPFTELAKALHVQTTREGFCITSADGRNNCLGGNAEGSLSYNPEEQKFGLVDENGREYLISPVTREGEGALGEEVPADVALEVDSDGTVRVEGPVRIAVDSQPGGRTVNNRRGAAVFYPDGSFAVENAEVIAAEFYFDGAGKYHAESNEIEFWAHGDSGQGNAHAGDSVFVVYTLSGKNFASRSLGNTPAEPVIVHLASSSPYSRYQEPGEAGTGLPPPPSNEEKREFAKAVPPPDVDMGGKGEAWVKELTDGTIQATCLGTIACGIAQGNLPVRNSPQFVGSGSNSFFDLQLKVNGDISVDIGGEGAQYADGNFGLVQLSEGGTGELEIQLEGGINTHQKGASLALRRKAERDEDTVDVICDPGRCEAGKVMSIGKTMAFGRSDITERKLFAGTEAGSLTIEVDLREGDERIKEQQLSFGLRRADTGKAGELSQESTALFDRYLHLRARSGEGEKSREEHFSFFIPEGEEAASVLMQTFQNGQKVSEGKIDFGVGHSIGRALVVTSEKNVENVQRLLGGELDVEFDHDPSFRRYVLAQTGFLDIDRLNEPNYQEHIQKALGYQEDRDGLLQRLRNEFQNMEFDELGNCFSPPNCFQRFILPARQRGERLGSLETAVKTRSLLMLREQLEADGEGKNTQDIRRLNQQIATFRKAWTEVREAGEEQQQKEEIRRLMVSGQHSQGYYAALAEAQSTGNLLNYHDEEAGNLETRIEEIESEIRELPQREITAVSMAGGSYIRKMTPQEQADARKRLLSRQAALDQQLAQLTDDSNEIYDEARSSVEAAPLPHEKVALAAQMDSGLARVLLSQLQADYGEDGEMKAIAAGLAVDIALEDQRLAELDEAKRSGSHLPKPVGGAGDPYLREAALIARSMPEGPERDRAMAAVERRFQSRVISSIGHHEETQRQMEEQMELGILESVFLPEQIAAEALLTTSVRAGGALLARSGEVAGIGIAQEFADWEMTQPIEYRQQEKMKRWQAVRESTNNPLNLRLDMDTRGVEWALQHHAPHSPEAQALLSLYRGEEIPAPQMNQVRLAEANLSGASSQREIYQTLAQGEDAAAEEARQKLAQLDRRCGVLACETVDEWGEAALGIVDVGMAAGVLKTVLRSTAKQLAKKGFKEGAERIAREVSEGIAEAGRLGRRAGTVGEGRAVIDDLAEQAGRKPPRAELVMPPGVVCCAVVGAAVHGMVDCVPCPAVAVGRIIPVGKVPRAVRPAELPQIQKVRPPSLLESAAAARMSPPPLSDLRKVLGEAGVSPERVDDLLSERQLLHEIVDEPVEGRRIFSPQEAAAQKREIDFDLLRKAGEGQPAVGEALKRVAQENPDAEIARLADDFLRAGGEAGRLEDVAGAKQADDLSDLFGQSAGVRLEEAPVPSRAVPKPAEVAPAPKPVPEPVRGEPAPGLRTIDLREGRVYTSEEVSGLEGKVLQLESGETTVLGRKLGEGSFGVVYCYDPRCGRIVKVPIFNPANPAITPRESLLQLQAEILRADALEGAGIPTARILNPDQNVKYLLKEFVEGPTVSRLLSSRRRLTEAQIDSLAEIYQRSILNGIPIDAHPGNLIWDETAKKFVLIDNGFGVDTLLEETWEKRFFREDSTGWQRFTQKAAEVHNPEAFVRYEVGGRKYVYLPGGWFRVKEKWWGLLGTEYQRLENIADDIFLEDLVRLESRRLGIPLQAGSELTDLGLSSIDGSVNGKIIKLFDENSETVQRMVSADIIEGLKKSGHLPAAAGSAPVTVPLPAPKVAAIPPAEAVTEAAEPLAELSSILELNAILGESEVKGKKVVSFLKRLDPDLKIRFQQLTGTSEGYTLEEHTLRVFEEYNQQTKFYSLRSMKVPEDVNLEQTVRATLALHNIGEGEAVAKGVPHLRQDFTLPILRQKLRSLGFTDNEVRIAESLAGHDNLLGEMATGKIMPQQAYDELRILARQSNMEVNDYYLLQKLFYTADTSSFPSSVQA